MARAEVSHSEDDHAGEASDWTEIAQGPYNGVDISNAVLTAQAKAFEATATLDTIPPTRRDPEMQQLAAQARRNAGELAIEANVNLARRS